MNKREEKIGPALASLLDTTSSRALAFDAAGDVTVFEVNVFASMPPEDNTALDLDDGSNARATAPTVELIRQQRLESQKGILSLAAQATPDVDTDSPHLLRSEARATVRSRFWITNSIGMVVTRRMVEALVDRGDVEHLELNAYAPLSELMDDGPLDDDLPLQSPTWSVQRINAPQLWSEGVRGQGVLVAILDTGVNYRHPDLQSHMWDGGAQFPHHGFDFENNDDDPIDDIGHGTSCAGIVAGTGASGVRTGVAPETTILAVRIGGNERTWWRGFEFAVGQRVHAISMSMTYKYPRRPDYPGWRRLTETVLRAGILHANSSGNQGDDLVTYPIPFNIGAPGNCPSPRHHSAQTLQGTAASVVSCGNVNSLDQLENNSGRGPCAWEKAPFADYPWNQGASIGLLKPDICAPGAGTTSVSHHFPGGPSTKPYTSFGGTSAATPHVGGSMALLASACLAAGTPIQPARIQETLEETAVRIPGQSQAKEPHFGAGRVDVYAAWRYGRNKGYW